MQELNHSIVVEELEGLKRKINITINSAGVDLALTEAVDSVSKKVEVKGFRKGKAPRKIIEASYPQEVKNVAMYMLVQSGFISACRENRITPLTEPVVEKAEIKLDGTFICEILTEIKPAISPVGYVGMSLKKEKVDYSKALEQRIDDLYEYYAFKEVRQEIQDGFEITTDFWVLVDNKVIAEEKDKVFAIRKGQEPPFGENLIGTKMGDVATANLTLPENYPEYGNKEAVIKIEVKLVMERIRPTQEQLVEKTKAPSYGDLISVVQKDVENTYKERERAQIEEQIIDQLIDLHQFDVPQKWVEDETKFLESQMQIKNMDENTKTILNNMATKNVKRTFILDSIFEAEPGLKLTEEEVEGFLKQEAGRLNVSVATLKSDIKKNNMVDGVIGLIKSQKVLNYILSSAQIEEVEAEHKCCCDHNCENNCNEGCCNKTEEKE